MKNKRFHLIALPLIFIVSLGCPGRVEFESGKLTLKDVRLPEGCEEITFSVDIRGHGPDERVATFHKNSIPISQEETDLGAGQQDAELKNINFGQEVEITITVRSFKGVCKDFAFGKKFIFKGKLTKEAEGKYSVGFRQFTSPDETSNSNS